MTEHAAVIFVFFFLAEYGSIVLICILTSILFLGGYLIYLHPFIFIINIIINILKLIVLGIMYLVLSCLEFIIDINYYTSNEIYGTFKDIFKFTLYYVISGDKFIDTNFIFLNVQETNIIFTSFISGILSSILLGIKSSLMIFTFI
jgi:NADH-ubiquinone oxidoreductase chain 1